MLENILNVFENLENELTKFMKETGYEQIIKDIFAITSEESNELMIILIKEELKK